MACRLASNITFSRIKSAPKSKPALRGRPKKKKTKITITTSLNTKFSLFDYFFNL